MHSKILSTTIKRIEKSMSVLSRYRKKNRIRKKPLQRINKSNKVKNINIKKQDKWNYKDSKIKTKYQYHKYQWIHLPVRVKNSGYMQVLRKTAKF